MILCFAVSSQYSLKNPHGSYLFAARGYSVDIDCQLNDPSVDVHLMQEKNPGSDKLLPRVPDGVKVTQSGQIFTINNVEDSDKGKYACKVQSTVIPIETLYPVNYRPQGNENICFA